MSISSHFLHDQFSLKDRKYHPPELVCFRDTSDRSWIAAGTRVCVCVGRSGPEECVGVKVGRYAWRSIAGMRKYGRNSCQRHLELNFILKIKIPLLSSAFHTLSLFIVIASYEFIAYLNRRIPSPSFRFIYFSNSRQRNLILRYSVLFPFSSEVQGARKI